MSAEDLAHASYDVHVADQSPASSCDRCEKVLQWAEAYPLEVFPEMTKAEWAQAATVLKAAGLSLDRISASNMRHVITRVAEIVKAQP